MVEIVDQSPHLANGLSRGTSARVLPLGGGRGMDGGDAGPGAGAGSGADAAGDGFENWRAGIVTSIWSPLRSSRAWALIFM